jgi:hypothetical protein
MIRPVKIEEIFQLNPDAVIEYHKDYVVIDNFYKDYDTIIDLLENCPAESWKQTDHSRNFIDYYDCRLLFANWQPNPVLVEKRLGWISQFVCQLLNLNSINIEQSFQFNMFKHIKKGVSVSKQHHPHYDNGMINVLVYLDRQSNGGTALYEDYLIENREATNLIVDISKFKVKEIIPAKPNRCVIFDGRILHGAYIEDNSVYEDNWRITQATILTIPNDKE